MADTPSHSPHSYAFAGFRFDPRARAVMRGEARIALPPKSLECLAYLLEHRDRAVGRDELIAAVWGRADVGYAVLAQTLWKARRALGEAHDDAHIVRTVSRFGYQWVAPVEVIDSSASRPIAATHEPADESPSRQAAPHILALPRRHVGRRGLLVLLAVALSAVIVASTWRAWRTPVASPALQVSGIPATDGKSFLVLPVQLDSAVGDDAWVRLGVMDYFASRLRDSGGVPVMPSDRVMALLSQSAQFDANNPTQLQQLKLVAGASHLVVPRAVHANGGWKFSFAVHASDAVETVEADAVHPLDAANRAIDRVLRVADVDAQHLDITPDRLAELLQRMDAASLAGEHDRALELARSASPQQRQDERLQLRIAQIDFRSGRIDEAAAGFGPLAESAAPVAANVRVAAKLGLASIAERRQRYDEAVSRYGEAITLLGDRGDPSLIGQAHMMRGLAEGYLGQVDRSLADFGRGRVATARSGDRAMLASLDVTIGLAERARGRYADAAAAFDRAIEVSERVGMNDRLATALIGAVGVRLAMLELPQALALSERGWQLAGKLQNPVLINYLALVRGEALLANGHLREVGALLDPLGAVAEPSNPAAVPDLLLLRVELHTAQRKPGIRPDEAAVLLDRIEHPAEPTYRTNLGAAIMTLAASALRDHDLALAETLLRRLREQAPMDADKFQVLASHLIAAEILAAKGDPGADAEFAAALAEVDRHSYPDALVSVCVAWARHLQQGGDRGTVAMLAGRLAPFVEHDFRAARAAAVLYRALGEQALADAAAASASALAGERDLNTPL